MNTVIVGMGALGLLFGGKIAENAGNDHTYFLMDSDRYERHSRDIYMINGRVRRFNLADANSPGSVPFPEADLAIIATKYGGLEDAISMLRPYIGGETVIISLLNGIISEDMIAGTYNRDNIIDCVPIGMDAMRDGCSVNYTQEGRLQVGIRQPSQKKSYDRLISFFDKGKVPYEAVSDIRHAMWNKFMINVGINQTCMVYETTYAGAFESPEASSSLKGAMEEVIELAACEGVKLTREDYDNDMKILHGLKPDGYPSMRQDAVAKRYSEVELFAGSVLRLAKKHGIETPVNRRYYDAIKEIESAY
ncbi:MAG: ketopantoate reductase family protein [Lachnospiraceae bacterium]|nr:ketopantoate reductase family protein [Lachnospiraceae bacterium]